eukprot:TRINITY_DN4895_c0_g1_i1.p1 TRINITY_DN4895_c0_g1~~TRINITY_DN4895_c0_g1_i1.p1  ORF type:complete len:536 (-),score=138.91 TRINITY_DN4895_c0_g1_i1:49-1656(-)
MVDPSAPLLNSSYDTDERKTKNSIARLVFEIVLCLLAFGIIFIAAFKSNANNHELEILKEQMNNMKPLPNKYVITRPHSVSDQHRRGTCYIFASIGVVEGHYLAQGREQGYLADDEWVEFSEQAYGVSLIDYCSQSPDNCPISPQATGNTNDGWSYFLYYFRDWLKDKILPHSVCPYQPEDSLDNDKKCDNYATAISKNPIKMNVKSMKTHYDLTSMKEAVVRTDRPLGFNIAILSETHQYVDCLEGSVFATTDVCKECKYKIDGKCKYLILRNKGLTGDGILTNVGSKTELRGEHLVNLVGFNDEFTYSVNLAKQLDRGILIIRNSWNVTNSHSLDYLTGKIGYRDEMFICPNGRNPRHWFMCDNYTRVDGYSFPDYWDKDLRDTIAHLQVTDTYKDLGFDPTKQYCISNRYLDSDTTYTFQLKEIDGSDNLLNLTGVQVDDLRSIFTRVGEFKQNDPDSCGYYGYPYSYYYDSQAQWADIWAAEFEIEFEESSYLKNANKYPEYDYEWVKSSTRYYHPKHYYGPAPWFDKETK